MIRLSIGNSRMEKHWNLVEMELPEFRDRVSHTQRTAETVEQYRKMSKAKQDEIKDVGGFVLGTLKGGRRKKDCVLTRSGLSLDMDYATEDIIDQIEMFFSFQCYVYSTHKHTPEKPRLRLIIPLSREVTPDEYCAVSRKVAEEIGIELFDDTTYEPSRLMYWPSTSSDGEFVFREITGDLLNPDTILAKYTDWHNTAEWPVSKRQQTIVRRDMKKQADPLEKPGVVGAFCRSYSITEAIDTFLTDVYKQSAMTGRYDYILADSQAGVVIYEDRFAYSHHATDPACGKLMNAFDVVRIHKFGALDAKAEEDTDPAKLPSFKAMQEFAIQDHRVKAQLAKERTETAQAEFTEEDGENWQTFLELDKQGKVKDTLTNIAFILRYDPQLKNIVFNEFKCMVDVIGPLPWRQVKPGWGDTDISCAKLYFERVYGIWSPTKFKDALLAVVSAERLYHPIKEYFSTLQWDGTERLDTLLIDYLGAEDTPYVRAVTRKTFTAAVARVYEPGIKFDSILVLNGPQGIGKSTLLLQVCQKLAEKNRKVLYISGEESLRQIKMRARRIGTFSDSLTLLCETSLALIRQVMEKEKPEFAVIDSIQTMYDEEVSSAPGSVSQVREATAVLMQLAKGMGISIFIVGHVTKDGNVAGPRVLEHMVDTVLYFEGDRHASYRILRGVKNRFGSTNEIGVFEMQTEGLAEVKNPSEFMLNGKPEGASGSVVACSMEGTRPILIEIQALVCHSNFGIPRRTAAGTDFNRVNLLMAVLEKRAGLNLSACDAYINIAGGIRMNEPAIDLGIVLAIASSFREIIIPDSTIAFGEVGLSGEVRAVNMPEQRVMEARKLGFQTVILPRVCASAVSRIEGIDLVYVENVSDAIRICGKGIKKEKNEKIC